jgi:hypothetical protein
VKHITDEQVAEWAARIVANAPKPTPTQLDLVRRIFASQEHAEAA